MNLELCSEDSDLVQVGCTGEVSQIRFRSGGNPLEELLGPACYGRKVLVDFGRAEWIDSSGISWLIATHQRFDHGGGMLVLHSLPPRVRSVLQFCKIDGVLNVAEDEEAARGMADKAKV